MAHTDLKLSKTLTELTRFPKLRLPIKVTTETFFRHLHPRHHHSPIYSSPGLISVHLSSSFSTLTHHLPISMFSSGFPFSRVGTSVPSSLHKLGATGPSNFSLYLRALCSGLPSPAILPILILTGDLCCTPFFLLLRSYVVSYPSGSSLTTQIRKILPLNVFTVPLIS